MNKHCQYFFTLLFFLLPLLNYAQKKASKNYAPKPLFADPVYDGAADPVIIWNEHKKEWWMFYTNRRANLKDSGGVEWVHGTRIGIARSKDGSRWTYLDTANINYRPDSNYTFWAPDIIQKNGIAHMYLTYVPGIFSNWSHPRYIVHLTSNDLINWDFVSKLPLVNEKVIDAAVINLPDGNYRLWYNNEMDGKSIFYADSPDLINWKDRGKAIASRGEGPKVFFWKGIYWMIVDVWKGMEIYHSTDLLKWTKQSSRILEEPGKGKDDAAIGGHCDVLVNDGKAYIFYFTHPGRSRLSPAPVNSIASKRSVIQLAELEYENGEIKCNRDKLVKIKLKPKK